MKCLKCGADIYDGVKKCPYCKTLTQSAAGAEDEKFKNFDIKYTITSDEQVKKIHQTIKETEKASKKNFVEKFLADRRAAKRAARRAARRGVSERTEENPFLQDTTVKDTSDEQVNTYTRVRKASKPQKKFSLDMKDVGKKAVAVGAVALCLIVLIWAVVALAGVISGGDETVASYTYVKDNSMYMIYKGKNLNISENVISDSYTVDLDEESDAPTAEEVAKASNMVHTTKDGKVTFFFDEYDPETNSGRLCRIKNGKIKKITQIAEAVHNSIVMTEDGEKLLYLQTADKNGDMGVLYYWEQGIDEPFKIATDIDHGTFAFADDGQWAMFLQNLNRVEMSGDLYAKSISKLKDEKIKLDGNVCKLFGLSQDGKSYLYGKDYSTEDNSFDIYAINNKSRVIRLGERTNSAPFFQKKKNSVYIYGLDDDGTNNLYTVDVNSGNKEKIASGMKSILMMSKDEKTIIFDKVYSGKLADYYAYTRGKQSQKVAGNVVVDYEVVADKRQMAASYDCRTVLYISEFESFKGGGTLTLCKYKNGRIVSEEQIAEDVYSCYRVTDDQFIYLKDYSPSRKVLDVYLLEGNESTLLKEEVSPDMFGISKSGEYMYYISNYGVEGAYGNLERMDMEGNAEELASEVFEFDISSLGDVLFYRNLNEENDTFDMCIIKEGKDEWTEINTAVDEILTY